MTGVILMYHRVAKPADDAYGLAVSPDHFGAQVAHLNDLDCVVPLTDILEPSKALKIAITFDDGYADNASTAAPLLASAEPSGYLFHHHGPARWQAFLVGPPGRRTA